MSGFPVLRSGAAGERDTLERDVGVPGPDVDPLCLLDRAGLGWLVEHVGHLREPLDWLAGHGDRFEDAVATWRQVAGTLDGIARRRAGGGWLTGEITAMSRVCRDVASHVAEVRAITAAVHGVFRDVVALYVREVLDNATVAFAAADLTCGSSVSDFATWAVGRGAVVLDRMTRRLIGLVRVMVLIAAALKALFGLARDMLKAITRFGE
ncbi:hypothetical protein AB0G02_06290 [Actinosynnema sp. NPDC023658]|uniref:hypothetical protein n=1 Tax=Actinosynnema sp. NPDC023658 TaxID=3155465 RepID=UPI0033E9EFA3